MDAALVLHRQGQGPQLRALRIIQALLDWEPAQSDADALPIITITTVKEFFSKKHPLETSHSRDLLLHNCNRTAVHIELKAPGK